MNITTKKTPQRSGSLSPYVRELLYLLKRKSAKLLRFRDRLAAS